MKNSLKLSFKLQSRKKTIIFNILFISISILVVLGINTYSDSAINYLNNDVYNSVSFKSLQVLTNEDDDIEKIEEALESLENVSVVTNFYAYSDMLNTKEFVNKKMDGIVTLYVANNKSLPKITAGSNFKDDNGNYMICPETLYATSDKEALKTTSKKYAINMKDYLNKDIEFTYNSYNDSYNYDVTFTVIGLYENNGYLDSDICFTQSSSLKTIMTNKYADDIDIITGESNILYQPDLFIQVDYLNNLDKVKREINNLGYNYEENNIIITSYFENIQTTAQRVTIIALFITLVILLLISIKQFSDDKDTYQLFYYLGYHRKSMYIISSLSNLIQLIISIIISMIVFAIIYIIFNMVLNYYPYILNGWQICVNYNSIIAVLIITILSTILSSIINILRIEDIGEKTC